MNSLKSIARYLLEFTPYRIVRRTSVNRFQAVEDAVVSLARRGFCPDVVIDGGANTGEFTRRMLALFPGAKIHAFEPQPGCQEDLACLQASSNGRLTSHAIAICAPADVGKSLTMATDQSSRSTGAHISTRTNGENGPLISVPCSTLDIVLEPYISAGDRVFLKLDLQGYELHALRGAVSLLKATDVILTEVSFFAQAYEPRISSLTEFLSNQGFELYDIGAIYARPRDNRPRQGDFIYVRRECYLAQDTGWS